MIWTMLVQVLKRAMQKIDPGGDSLLTQRGWLQTWGYFYAQILGQCLIAKAEEEK